jgi:hypothetical protein
VLFQAISFQGKKHGCFSVFQFLAHLIFEIRFPT